ncbi:MAG: tellurite resistance TerB family protein [Atribacterota bacterium]|jgi:tellurite resistance protein TerB|nr:tellurite resistance TerB family protein [Atribacterota bacterium]
MAVLDWIKKQTDNLQTEIGRFRNKELMEGIVAGCAIVAYADGFVSPEEKQKMVGFIKQSDALKVFEIEKVIETFNKYLTKFEFDFQIGKGEALASITRLKSKPDQGQLLVRVCMAIGAADGNFDPKERDAVIMICHELGLNPKNFEL